MNLFESYPDYVSNDDMTDSQRIAAGLCDVANAIIRLGNADACTPMGGLEGLGAVLKEAMERHTDAMDSVATAIMENR